MYQKSIHDISYSKLKKLGIKCLVFDLDNTIAFIDQSKITEDTKQLLLNIKKDFQIIIISNNTKKRVKPYANTLQCDYISSASKPLSKGFRKIRKQYHLSPKQMCMIGDQIVTDIFGGNRYGMFTILVDPLGKKDLKITSLNRLIERIILNRYEKRNIMRRGDYYE